ncbi:MAG TPA: polysaccharide deacetylase family protein [Bacillota bacterium]|nr:polysaccharide deacetylase family protein [Bacillota bacterium]
MITVKLPPGYTAERTYITNTVFKEFLGLDVNIQFDEDRRDVLITDENGRRSLVLADRLFSFPKELWLAPGSLPRQPLKQWDVQGILTEVSILCGRVPVIYGIDPETTSFFETTENKIRIGLDILGSAFFMLTRYEELVNPIRDEHDRFPAEASLAFHAQFLERPVIDEYVEILWACIARLWPGLQRRGHEYKAFLTHDVDEPFGVKDQSIPRILKRVAGDVLVRRSPRTAVRRLCSLVRPGEACERLDPNNTFDWLMDESEAMGLESAFYFMAGTKSDYDSGYDLRTGPLQRLLRRIHERGHEIGLHPGYGTYRDGELLITELSLLREAMAAAGVCQEVLGGRHHYLRWDPRQTWQHWDAAGLSYDSTLSFAQQPGFRSGTCREYPVFSLISRSPLRLRERPLILMDASLLSREYMALSQSAVIEKIAALSNACRRVRGTFTLLWHNDMLITRSQRLLFRALIEILK